MALVLANRVQETATPNTTVSFTLTGAVSGFQTFAVIGNTNTTYYSATDTAGNWEVGEGTYSTTGPTLTRTTVYASSNSGSAVTFPGTVNVFVTYPSGKSVNLDGAGNVSALGTVTSGTWQGSTVGVAYGGTGQTSYTNGQLLIGNTTCNTLTKATLTAGTGICISNGAGSITISSTASVACATPTVAGKVFGKTQTALAGGRVALGYNAGLSGQGCNAIAIGVNAGSTNQPMCSIAVGAGSTATTSCSVFPGKPVAVGASSYSRDDAVAVGRSAIAGACSVAIGRGAGYFSICGPLSTSTVTIGATAQAYNSQASIVLGSFAGTNCAAYGVAIGYGAFVNAANSIIINATGSPLCVYAASQTHIAPIRSVCSTTGLTSLFYNACTKEVVQAAGGGGVCCATPTAAGIVYGRTMCALQGKTALGYWAGFNAQGCYAVALGLEAGKCGQNNRAVAVGRQAAATSQGAGAVAIGYRAGELNQGGSAIAIGDCAAWNTQRTNAIAIGFAAGGANQGACSIAIGANATVYGPMCPFISALAVAVGSNSFADGCGVAFGSLAYASNSSVAVGKGATTLNPANVAIGHNASIPGSIGSISIGASSSISGSTNNAVAVGTSASIATCSCYSIAIGNSAQATTKAGGSIAIGYSATAGWTPCCFMPVGCSGSIAIGKNTSVRSSFNTANIAIGANTTIPSYAVASRIIALNATGNAWTVCCTTGFYVDSVGQMCTPPNCCTSYALQYCIGSKKISYGPGGGGGGSPATPTVAGVVYGRTDTACCGNNTMLGKSLNVGSAVSSNVVIGTCSTWVRNYNTSNVIVGQSANTCCCVNSSVVVGLGAYAGYGTSFGVAIGGYSSVGGALGVAIGNGAYAGTWAVAVGSMSYAGANSVVLNGTGSLLCSVSNSFYVKPVRNANGPYTLKYDPSSGEITYI